MDLGPEDGPYRYIVPAIGCWAVGALALVAGLLYTVLLATRWNWGGAYGPFAVLALGLLLGAGGLMVAAGVGVYKGNVGWAGAARALAFTLGVTGILVSAADGFMQGFRQRDTFEFEFSVRNVTEGVIAGAMLLLGDALSKMIKRRTEELAGAPREAPPADAPWR